MLARTTANTRACEVTIRATAFLPCIGSMASISARAYAGGDASQGPTQQCHEHPSGALTSLSVVYGRALISVSIGPRDNQMAVRSGSMRDRLGMYNANTLKVGMFGANCSSGRSATKVPERWSASWPDCLRLACMADEAGIDFILPIGRWKGYGGDTDFHGATLETKTWAAGLLAATKRITVFGTVHAPLFNPVIAAKEIVTADHIGQGRFGLNLVVGWNEGEFEMFGVKQRDHEARYQYAQERLHVLKLIWSPKEDVDFDGRYFSLKGSRRKPKPVG